MIRSVAYTLLKIVVQRPIQRIRFFIKSSITFYMMEDSVDSVTSERTVYPGIHTVTWTGWTEKVRQIVNNSLRLQMICPCCKGELSIFLPFWQLPFKCFDKTWFYSSISGQRFLFIPTNAIHFLICVWHLIVLLFTSSQSLTFSDLEFDVWQVWVNVIHCLNGMNVCVCVWLLFIFPSHCAQTKCRLQNRESRLWQSNEKKKHSTLIVVNEVYCVTKSFESDAFCRCERLRVFWFVSVAFTGTDGPISNFLIHTLIQIYRDGVISMGFHALYLAHKTNFRILRTRSDCSAEFVHDLQIFAADRIVKSLICD